MMKKIEIVSREELDRLNTKLTNAYSDYNYCCSLPHNKTRRIRKVLKKRMLKAESIFNSYYGKVKDSFSL